jgi:diadenosine hexaphosphate hydrolase (ATP-forming)
VFYQGKLLILERFNKVWLFPKGHIDPGETAPEAAAREVREECGLSVRILGELGETSYSFMENDLEHFKSVQWYLMEAISGEITLEKIFFTAARLIADYEIDQLSFESDRELAQKGFEVYRSFI